MRLTTFVSSAVLLTACGGSAESNNAGSVPGLTFEVVEGGSGVANESPLMPLAPGTFTSEYHVEGAIEDGGTLWRRVVHHGNGDRHTLVDWMRETDDGVASRGLSGVIDTPILLVPHTVRHGMRWKTANLEGSAERLESGSATVTWQIEISGGGVSTTFLFRERGFGEATTDRFAVVPRVEVDVAPLPAARALEPLIDEATGEQAVMERLIPTHVAVHQRGGRPDTIDIAAVIEDHLVKERRLWPLDDCFTLFDGVVTRVDPTGIPPGDPGACVGVFSEEKCTTNALGQTSCGQEQGVLNAASAPHMGMKCIRRSKHSNSSVSRPTSSLHTAWESCPAQSHADKRADRTRPGSAMCYRGVTLNKGWHALASSPSRDTARPPSPRRTARFLSGIGTTRDCS